MMDCRAIWYDGYLFNYSMSEKGEKSDQPKMNICLVLSTTQQSSVYCHKEVTDPENIHIKQAGIWELWLIFLRNYGFNGFIDHQNSCPII